MKKIKFLTCLFIVGLAFSITACEKAQTPEPSPTTQPVSLSPQPMDILASTPSSSYPVSPEASINALLTTYQKQGYEALKTEWLTKEYAITMSFRDFLATDLGGMSSTPAALKSWEIKNIENDPANTAGQGATRIFIKTKYEGDVSTCRWLALMPPSYTGDHWRITNNENVACEQGLTPSAAAVQASVTPQAKSTEYVWYPCANAMPSQLNIGMVVYVSPEPPLAVRIRSTPGLNGEKQGYINPGEIITIAGGPICADKMVYWEVEYSDVTVSMTTKFTGWVAEGGDGTRWLLPCPAQGPCGGGFTPVRTAPAPKP